MNTRELKISKNSEKGKLLTKLMEDIKLCDKASDDLAIELGCQKYMPVIDADFGGIAAFEFQQKVNKKIWECVDNTKGQKLYTPKVNTRTQVLEAEKALALTGENVKVGEREYSFAEVSLLFSREEAAQMAGVKLTTPSIEQLCKSYGVSQKDMSQIRIGIPVEQVLPNATAQQQTQLRIAHKEDSEIMTAMEGRKFRSVLFLSGNKEAIAILRKMMDLPIVPNGTINQIVGVANARYRCGVREEGDEYIVTIPDNSDGKNC